MRSSLATGSAIGAWDRSMASRCGGRDYGPCRSQNASRAGDGRNAPRFTIACGECAGAVAAELIQKEPDDRCHLAASGDRRFTGATARWPWDEREEHSTGTRRVEVVANANTMESTVRSPAGYVKHSRRRRAASASVATARQLLRRAV